jgi:hypothetical protein
MCNCKGWDVSYHATHVSIGPHFCRTYGDCGSTDRPMEEAAEECAVWHERQAKMWRDGTHPDLEYYRSAKS